MLQQRTLKTTVSCKGIGLHTGKVVGVALHPAPPNHGIQFIRTDTARRVRIPACIDNVVDTTLATTLGKDGVVISTVEHLLSACLGLGLDNLMVEVDGPEVPIMDGSAAPYIYLLRSVGIKQQSAYKRFLAVKRPIHHRDNGRWASILPCDRLEISFEIQFRHPRIGNQCAEFSFSDKAYDKEISRARTFGFMKDVEVLQNSGYALGGSLDNAVVLDDFQVLNDGGLRYDDEFVRHKILDTLGDLAMIGMPLIGRFVGFKSGHALNHQLIKKMIRLKHCWEVVGLPEASLTDDRPGSYAHEGKLDIVPMPVGS